MKILIMSDTHGDCQVIDKVRNFYPEIDVRIHCGDSELPYVHDALKGMKKVRGNCDREEAFPEEEIFTVDDVRILVTHGHLFNVKSSMLSLTYRAKELNAQIVCFGHSHILGAEMMDHILFINPGSLLKPRGRKEKSFAVLEIKDSTFTVEFWTDDQQCMSSHTFQRN